VDKSKGYFLVWRSLDDWEDWHEKPFTRGQAWIDMLMKTNFQDKSERIDGHLITSERGQLVMSQSRMASRWGWSRGRVQSFLKTLETRHQIKQQNSPVTSIITICNYDDGQNFQQQKKQQKSSRAAADQQQSSSSSIRKNSYNTYNSPNTPPTPSMNKAHASNLQEMIDYCKTQDICQSDAEYLWNNWEENGWTRGKKPIKDWHRAVVIWKLGGYLPSHKNPKQESPKYSQEVLDAFGIGGKK
jgi:hypothetical protein